MSAARRLQSVYASPQIVTKVEDCWFYHTLDLPQHGTVAGAWDLRPNVDAYLGGVDFRHKRVLELGPASGFLTFAMESKGAEVIGVELPPGQLNDLVPRATPGIVEQYVRDTTAGLEQLRSGFWLAHRLLHSGARVVYSSVYAIPAEVGHVDIATFGCILLHLRDPFLALANALRLTREKAVVTMMMHDQRWETTVLGRHLLTRLYSGTKQTVKRALGLGSGSGAQGGMLPCMVFLPEYTPGSMDTWWFLTPAIVQQFLAILGFEDATTTYHTQIYKRRATRMYTVVAKRTQPLPTRIDGPYPWY